MIMNLTILTDEQLESAWQKSTLEIETYYANDGNENEKFLEQAKEAQETQSLIQKEITRRE